MSEKSIYLFMKCAMTNENDNINHLKDKHTDDH